MSEPSEILPADYWSVNKTADYLGVSARAVQHFVGPYRSHRSRRKPSPFQRAASVRTVQQLESRPNRVAENSEKFGRRRPSRPGLPRPFRLQTLIVVCSAASLRMARSVAVEYLVHVLRR